MADPTNSDVAESLARLDQKLDAVWAEAKSDSEERMALARRLDAILDRLDAAVDRGFKKLLAPQEFEGSAEVVDRAQVGL